MNPVTELKTINIDVDYKEDKELISKFVLFYNENEEHTYLEQIRDHKPTIHIKLDDLAMFDESGIVNRIENNAFTYLDIFYSVIDEILFNEGDYLIGDNDEDIFFYHRISRFKEKFPEKNVSEIIPNFLLRTYYINLIPRSTSRILSARQIKSEQIGSLVRVSGVVTKVSQVKPNVKVATYICESCGSEIYQQVNGDVFDLLEECTSEKCKLKRVKGTLVLVTRGSKFLKYQSLQIQELTNDVPQGCIPRMINVECYGTTTEKCLPGDVVVVGGIFLPKPYYGIKKMKAGLLTDTYMLATHVQTTKTDVQLQVDDTKLFDINTLVRNIAPEIYGMEDVKKILLLMLVGAPTKIKKDGMKIRGDINVLLLGDPGIAKSQLLKTVVKISKRGIYTTGRGSSGVGLTASVSKDPITNEVILEGGALVLSDMGICCIDELDKMGELDRVSIHEVMEQQSVSISKAGINTTLNARCAVLGAANPVKGKYDIRHSVEHNVGLPCSLLSRFDILVVLKDDADEARDKALAEHVTSLHLEDEKENVNYREIRNYIDKCKIFDPVIPEDLSNKLLEAYIKTRKENEYTTPRYLLSLIRLSLAHARARLSNIVSDEDVTEVLRLMEVMKIPSIKKRKPELTLKQKIYEVILSLVYRQDGHHSYVKIEDIWSATDGLYTRNEVEDVISAFSSTGIFVRNNEEIIILK
ncbi:DNA replication licensing factor MCM7 [Nosema granulosis]|uniref:DNA replication licensing factor MCM7 n=1 Tax=Nosema granulosis TaxID=83296 RepID=A0A9P6L089_9MICR|nr:DNA replication licensing factor MCM7 [Nosema granulosis]